MDAIAVEIATAYVSLVASAKGIAASIATELGAPAEKAGKDAGDRAADAFARSFTRAATDAGQAAGEGIESALKRTAGGVDVAAPVIGKPVVPEPDTEKMDASVVAAARRAAEKATKELSAIPGGIDAATFEAKVNAAATAAANQAKARLANIPVTLDIGKIGAQAASAAKIEPPEIPPPDDSKFISGAKKAGVAAGAAIGAGLAVGFAVAAATDVSNDKLAGQLGINDPTFAKDLGKVAGKVYGNAFGESIGEVNAAIRAVLQNGLVPEDATNAAIQSVTEKVLGLASTFEQDLGGTASAVGQLMKTGMAKDATEALDLITRGFQQGADRRGDFLDTITEYGTQFRKLGIDGPKAIGLLSQGLRGGARDADIVADAIKEFSIRAIDGTETTAEGFRQVGLDATAMANAVGAGGPRAAAALDTVLDRLRAMPDPVLRAQAAVALFGTQSEDLGDALTALDPSKAVQGLGDIAGAADKMNAVVGDNAATAFESFKRNALGALSDVAGEFAPVIGGALELAPALGGLALVAPHIASVATKLGTLVTNATGLGGAAQGMRGFVGQTAKVAGAAGGMALLATALHEVESAFERSQSTPPPDLSELTNSLVRFQREGKPTGAVAREFGQDLGGLASKLADIKKLGGIDAEPLRGFKIGREAAQDIEALDKSLAELVATGNKPIAADLVKRLAGDAGVSVKDLTAVLGDYKGALAEADTEQLLTKKSADSLAGGIEDGASAFDTTAKSIEGYDDAMNRLIGVHVSAERAAIDYAEAHHNLAAAVQENGRSLDLATVGGRANREAILGLITATTDHVEAMRNEGATADQMNATFATHRAELARVLGQLGLNKDESARYLSLLDQVPATVFTKADVDTDEATKRLLAWQALLAKQFEGTWGKAVPLGGQRFVPRFHGGGIVPGPPGSEMLALVQSGERITAAAQVAADAGGGTGGLNVGDINVTSARDDRIGRDVRFELQNLVHLLGV